MTWILVGCAGIGNNDKEEVTDKTTATQQEPGATPTTLADETTMPTEPTVSSPSNDTFGTSFATAAEAERILASERPEPDPSQPCYGRPVRMARAEWDAGWFRAAVFEQILTEFGCTFDPIMTLSNEDFYQAVVEGKVDFWVNGWFPLHNSHLDNPSDKAKVELLGSAERSGALQGYLMDKASADRLGITSIDQLQDQIIAAEFDVNNNGKADLIGCPTDWGCAAIIDHHLKEYRLTDTVEHIQGDYNTLMEDLVQRFATGEPVLFYTWTPNWTIGRLVPGVDVVWIEVPYGSIPNDPSNTFVGASVSGCVEDRDPCMMGYPPNDILVVANKAFLQNPSIRILLDQINIDFDEISAQNTQMYGLSANEMATALIEQSQAWVVANRARVDDWMQAAAEQQDILANNVLVQVQQRGTLRCGINGNLRGFSYRESNGEYTGFDADFCRVIATAVLGDSEAVEFVEVPNLTSAFQKVYEGDVDVLFRNTTWTALRDLGMDPPNYGVRLDFGPIILHDGQRFMVRRNAGIATLADLNQKSICVLDESNSEHNLDQLVARGIAFYKEDHPDSQLIYTMYDDGRCDAITSDTTQLVSRRLDLTNPDAHIILDEPISREPLSPVFLEGQSQWADIVNWSIYATIYAAELDVTQDTIAQRSEDSDPSVLRLLGERGDIGSRLGLDNLFARRIIEQIGNYTEIYDRNLGKDSLLNMESGPNKVWNDKEGPGGMLYSPPFR
jgi:general L-amino acid transport system substrate-binding protein